MAEDLPRPVASDARYNAVEPREVKKIYIWHSPFARTRVVFVLAAVTAAVIAVGGDVVIVSVIIVLFSVTIVIIITINIPIIYFLRFHYYY